MPIQTRATMLRVQDGAEVGLLEGEVGVEVVEGEWVGCGMVDFTCEWCVFDAVVVGLTRWWGPLARCEGAWMKATGTEAKEVRQHGREIVGVHGADRSWTERPTT